ncbi:MULTISPECIES: hypothetical protein [unclassified Streptomyces]|uniref:hypothetical protein n=1 Tax=unclassified Streptomyces TaxID=2593676 RepID=UPI00081F5C43|nr:MULTISPECIES: hypothetical protein [unclassified Streptomyces]MYZ33691.1 hypothetical protein [Streptomyces sp. SID4917]SCF61014.1 hypothetical protein GA0115259_1001227 [Streptomyces sp. MnatMP-M17]
MSPPPPPLGRLRRRGSRSDQFFDPALDDAELGAVRDQLAQGRWSEARTLLAATGDDWDRRGHRAVVLAQAAGAVAWTRDWLLAEPDSSDAATLLACATAVAALRGKEREEKAREACREAVRRSPADPTPWLGLLLLARTLGTEEETARLFDEVRSRHPEHHHAHHLMAARLAERHPDAGQDPLHEVYDFASWAAEQAPADSPLAVLPVVAHAERYRVLAAAGHEPADPAGSGHWTGRRARQVLKVAFDWWLEWESEEHPRNRVDLNFLAHAQFHDGRTAEAAALFQRIGPHITPAPWSYPDRDPRKAFTAARDAAFGAA